MACRVLTAPYKRALGFVVTCAVGCSKSVHTEGERGGGEMFAATTIDAGVVSDAYVLPDAAGALTFGRIGLRSYGGGITYQARTYRTPTMVVGAPIVQTGLDAAIVRRYIRRNQWKLMYCYEKRQLAKSDLAGSVSTQFTIARDGSVVARSATGLDPEVESCIERVLEAIEFPKPETGLSVEVSCPLIFHPPS